jgi:plastocyanin
MTHTLAGFRPRLLSLRSTILATVLATLLAGGAVPAALGQATQTVVIGRSLEPSRLEVAAGTSVTWRNDDTERHRMRSQDGPVAFDSGNLDPGGSFTFTFDVEGTYTYLDERNDEDAGYVGTIVVVAPGAASPLPGGSPAPLAQAGEVSVVDRAFLPLTLEVATGATVTWSNVDTESHTVTALDGAFESGIMAEGATFSATLDTPGTYDYFCAIHPEMRGTVSVVDPASTTPAVPTAPVESVPPDAPAIPVDGEGAEAAPAGADVSLIDRTFQPASVEVSAGGSVTWTNADTERHTVTALDGTFDSGIMAEGATFSATLDTPGTYDYFCAIHPEMRGSVTVATAAGAPAGDG